LEEIAPEPLAEMHPATARRHRLAGGDRIVIATRRGTATFPLHITSTIREDTVFVPFHWAGSQSANRLTNPVLDPVSGMPEFKVCAARVTKAPEEATEE